MSSMLRSLARNRAKENMKAMGMVRLCSKDKGKPTTFAEDWRKYTNGTITKKKKGVKA